MRILDSFMHSFGVCEFLKIIKLALHIFHHALRFSLIANNVLINYLFSACLLGFLVYNNPSNNVRFDMQSKIWSPARAGTICRAYRRFLVDDNIWWLFIVGESKLLSYGTGFIYW